MFTYTRKWHNDSLGRISKNTLFILAYEATDKELSLNSFNMANEWQKKKENLTFDGLEYALKAAEKCNLVAEGNYFKNLIKIEKESFQ